MIYARWLPDLIISATATAAAAAAAAARIEKTAATGGGAAGTSSTGSVRSCRVCLKRDDFLFELLDQIQHASNLFELSSFFALKFIEKGALFKNPSMKERES
jgi:hypothetical protein